MEQKDFILIDLIQQNSILYDKSRQDFKDKIKKDNVWQSVASEMQWTVSECMTRWQSLKDKYTREKKEVECVKSGSAAPKKGVSDLYKIMSFMRDHIVYRKRTTKTNTLKPTAPTESQNDYLTNALSEIICELDVPILNAEDAEEMEEMTEETAVITPNFGTRTNALSDNILCELDVSVSNDEKENTAPPITPTPSFRTKRRKLEENLNHHLETMNKYLNNNNRATTVAATPGISKLTPFFVALQDEFTKLKPNKQKKLKLQFMQTIIENQSDSDN